jgi:hypothetical protein
VCCATTTARRTHVPQLHVSRDYNPLHLLRVAHQICASLSTKFQNPTWLEAAVIGCRSCRCRLLVNLFRQYLLSLRFCFRQLLFSPIGAVSTNNIFQSLFPKFCFSRFYHCQSFNILGCFIRLPITFCINEVGGICCYSCPAVKLIRNMIYKFSKKHLRNSPTQNQG